MMTSPDGALEGTRTGVTKVVWGFEVVTTWTRRVASSACSGGSNDVCLEKHLGNACAAPHAAFGCEHMRQCSDTAIDTTVPGGNDQL